MKIINIAKAFLGLSAPDGDDLFIAWYNGQTGANFSVDDTPWCHIFVTYCLTEAGASNFPLTAGCTTAMNWYKAQGLWHDPQGYNPSQGDVIYFDWDQTGDADHVGFVSYLDDKIHTIEGNTGDAVKERTYAYNDPRIRGFATPTYPAEVATDPFTDIAEHWAYSAILDCAQTGIVLGDGTGQFNPDEALTRAQYATATSRLLNKLRLAGIKI